MPVAISPVGTPCEALAPPAKNTGTPMVCGGLMSLVAVSRSISDGSVWRENTATNTHAPTQANHNMVCIACHVRYPARSVSLSLELNTVLSPHSAGLSLIATASRTQDTKAHETRMVVMTNTLARLPDDGLPQHTICEWTRIPPTATTAETAKEKRQGCATDSGGRGNTPPSQWCGEK
eukprot:CAMPEP_0194514482 /NCGR_PEP_ID=MMETSP0253-20130528/46949_1 /TAXON_ID=2966 /ORGANISM="Noctiluca scintillans" /LENGTH=177 /DNA_ID=CAMNT_0039358145 /DNA_START=247 /DNA_END=781 /DNA_ORIENTATION=-